MSPRSFAEFWPLYLRAHSRRGTRILHAAGSVLALGSILLGAFVNPWLLLLAPLFGYGFAWYGHFFVERNRPATFGHPFYSLAADYVMIWKMITGSIARELEKHGGAAGASPSR